MDKQILYSIALDTSTAINSWNKFIDLIQKGNSSFFGAIGQVVSAYKEEKEQIDRVVSSQEKLVNSKNELINISKNEINSLKSEKLEKEALLQTFSKEEQKIKTTTEAYRILNKERQNEINSLKLQNKERTLDITSFKYEIKDNKKTVKNSDDTLEIKTLQKRNNELKEGIQIFELLNHENNKKIKTIQDEINETNKLLATEKELLSIGKIKSNDLQNNLKDTSLKIKNIQLENQILQENLKTNKDVNKENVQDIKDIKDKIQISQLEKNIIQEKITELRTLITNLKVTSEAEKEYKANVQANIADLVIQKNQLQSNINIYQQHKAILENNSLAENINSISIKSNYDALSKQKEALQVNIQKENELKESINNKKLAEQEEIKQINAKIISLSNQAKELQSNISAQLQIKNTTSSNSNEGKNFKDSIDKNIDSLKNQKKEITDNIRVLVNQRDVLKNSNVELINNNNAINQNLGLLQKQRDNINSLPKSEPINNDTSMLDKFLERVKSYTIGTIISQTIRNILQEIKQFFEDAKKEALSLERTIANIRGLVLEQNLSFEDANNKIKNISNKSGTLFSDTSEGLRKIIAGGIEDTGEALKVYEESSILAKTATSKFRTEQQNLNDVTNSAILLLNNYNLKAKDLPTVYNQIAIAATKSKLDVVDFAKYLGGQSSEFSSFKGQFSDMISLFALFSNKLRNSSEADVALRSFVKKIQSPTDEMKKFSQEAKKAGLDIDFTPSALQKKGFNQYFKELFGALENFSFPQDIIKDLFNLAQASKGIQAITQSFKNVNEQGQTEFEELKNKILNDTDTLKNQYDLIINTLDERLNILSNSIRNFFISAFISSKEFLSDLVTSFTNGLNITIGLLKELFDTLTFGFGSGELKSSLSLFLSILQGIAIEFEFILKILNSLSSLIGSVFSGIADAFSGLFLIVKDFGTRFYNLIFGNKEEKERAKQGFLNYVDDVVKTIEYKMDEKNKNVKDKFSSIFDFSNYASINPQNYIQSNISNNAKTAEKKDFKAGTLFVGTGEIDNNTKLLEDVKKDIDKNTLDKFVLDRKNVLDKYKQDLKNAKDELQKIQDIAPKEIAELQLISIDPDKTEAEKKKALDDINKFQKLLENSQNNFNALQIALEKRKNAELAKINEEEQKKKEQEYKKKTDEIFQAKVYKQQSNVNDVETNDNLPKPEILKLKNVELQKLIQTYKEWGNAFKAGSKDREEHYKQASDIEKQIAKNIRDIEKEGLRSRLENSKEYYQKRINDLKLFSLENKIAEDTNLNNQLALDKTRILELKKSLDEEKKLSFEQKKEINREIIKLENDNLEKIIKIADIRRERKHQINLEEINSEVEKYNILVQLGLESEKTLLQQEINSNNQKIELLKTKSFETQDEDKIRNYNKEIKDLENKNILNSNEIDKKIYNEQKERNDKLFADRIKSINFLKDLKIYTDKEVLQESLKVLSDEKKAINDNINDFENKYSKDPKNEQKKKELDDLKTKQIENFREILLKREELENFMKEKDKEELKRKLDFISSIKDSTQEFISFLKDNNSTKNIGELLGVGNKAFSTGIKLFDISQDDINKINQIEDKINNLDIFQSDANYSTQLNSLLNQKQEVSNNLNSKINNIGTNLAISETLKSIQKMIEFLPKLSNEINLLISSYKVFGSTSEEGEKALKRYNETISEQLKIIPVVGDLISGLARAFTDMIGLTTSEKDKQKLKDLELANIEYQKTKLNAYSNFYESKLELDKIAYNEELKNLQSNFYDEEVYNKQKLSIDEKYYQLKLQRDREYYDDLQKLKDESLALDLEQVPDDINNKKALAYQKYQEKLRAIKKQYNLSDYDFEMTNDPIILNSSQNAWKSYRNEIYKIDIESSNKTIDLNKNLEKSRVELWEESLNKKYELAKLDYEQELMLAEREKAKGQSDEDYLKTKEYIYNKYIKKINDINKEASDKIRGINEKNYNEELKSFESLYKSKTDKVKSELQKQFDVISEYDQKIKDLREKRDQDQELKDKRALALKNDLSIKRLEVNNRVGFFTSNQEDFETGNGLTTGNQVLIKKVEQDFLEGKISLEERNDKRKQLALEKYIYYQQQLNIYQNPTKRIEINDKITQATNEYYDFVFDKEKEKLDLEKRDAERKKIILQQELIQREANETQYINTLNTKYKDAAGLYKDSFVSATKDWVSFAQKEGIEKLGVEAYKTITQAGNNINDNTKEAQKYINSNIIKSNSPTNNLINNNVTTPDKPINVTSYSNNNSSNNSKSTTISPSNPFANISTSKNQITAQDIIFTPAEVQAKIQESLLKEQKLKILNNIYLKQGASKYEEALKLTDSQLLDYAQRSDIPLMANSGVTKGITIAGEKGSEVVLNYPKMSKMYDFITKDLYKQGGNSNIVYAPVFNFNGYLSNENEFKKTINSEMKNHLKELRINISNTK